MYSYQSFRSDANRYRTIPISYSFFSDTLTPIQLFQCFQKEAKFMLESNDPSSPWSNYSFIGINPMMMIRSHRDGVSVFEHDQKISENKTFKESYQSVLSILQVKTPDLELPFKGGGVGYMSYDAISDFEKVPPPKENEMKIERYHFLFCQTLIAYDHAKRKVTVLHYVRLNGKEDEEQLQATYEQAQTKIQSFLKKIRNDRNSDNLMLPVIPEASVDFQGVKSNYTKQKFIDDVNKIKEYIRSGDIFQAVLSQRFEKEITIDGFDLYRVLRQVNPSPYLFYIKADDFELIGSSPERLIQIQDEHLEIHPIAGTRRRGKTLEEDQLFENELLADEKEQAEHYMLVDLARNDIGRVAQYGSVKTPMLMEVGRFSHVMHLVSKVTGKLYKDIHPIDAFISSFPAGTVSGAPKIRAMQILRELEPTARTVYAGAVCYLGFDGNIDSCITIRTILLKENTAYVQAGAGVVADSKPELEYKETLNKASALLRTIQVAEQMFQQNSLEGVRSHG